MYKNNTITNRKYNIDNCYLQFTNFFIIHCFVTCTTHHNYNKADAGVVSPQGGGLSAKFDSTYI